MTEDSVKVCEAMFRVAVDERLKELLSNEYYRTQLGLEGGVIDDGPMNEAAWASRNDGKRVMWLLKEHNGPACTYDETASAYGVSHDRKRMYWDLHTKPDVFAGNVNYFKTLKLMELASRGILEENPHVRYEHVGKYAVSTNGENAFDFFVEKLRPGALYLLDEPENSLSAKWQVKLAALLEGLARFENCQLVIATHSPFLLGIKGAKIYDLDSDGAPVRKWTDLENVREYSQFFQERASEFKPSAVN